MQHFPDRGGGKVDVEEAFADPSFAEPKARGVPFAILRPGSGDVLWANAAAAEHWGAGDPAGLAKVLFGPDGRGGWLDGLTRGLVPGRAPRFARAGLGRGFGMRARTALVRAWTAGDGAVLIGIAVPDAGVPDAGGEAWRRQAWAIERAMPSDAAASEAAGGAAPVGDEGDAGPALARRGQLAVLRDRLSRATDGGASLRLLWRTDAAGNLLLNDADAFTRLGSPLRLDAGAWPDVVGCFDPVGAERLRSALAARETWAGLRFDLPVADAAATVPMTLSGSPVFGPRRDFAGFRGFGILDLGGLALAPRRAGATDDVRGEAAAGEPPPAEPPVSANVVHLRAFQGSVPPRPGTPPVAVPPSEPAPAAATPADGTEPDPAPDGPLDDRLAFLALGEALRARIGAPPRPAEPAPEAGVSGDEPAAITAAAPEPAAGEAARLLDRLPVAILATVDGKPVFANPAAAARLGYADPAALLGAGPTLATPDGTLDIERGDAAGHAAPPPARRVEVPWGDAVATLWLLEDAGEPDGEPVPGPPEAPAAEEAEGGAAALLDRVDDAVALLDATGRVRRLNRRGEGWFGHPGAGEAIGRPFTDLLAPESRPAALALLGEVKTGRDGPGAPPPAREVVARTGEATPVPMLLTLGRLGTSGFYATLRDVTALKRAETDRARTERDRAQAAGRLPDLLARISHEIRTPLGAILGFAEVMMDERFGPLGNPRYRDYLKDIHASGAQVVAMVDDLLDLSRIEAGRLDLDVAAVDVNRIVSETVAQMQPEAHRERVIMRTSLAGHVPLVLADERSTRQIVKNLLSNAVKFNEPGGQVIVSTALDEAGAVLLRVRDTGVGMSDEEIAAALEPFGGLPARSPAGGNGLGLPLTRALIGANGASMAIRSRPREGTLVEVAFAPAGSAGVRRPA